MAAYDDVMHALTGVIDPELRKDLVSLGMIKGVQIDGGHATVQVALTTPGCPRKREINDDVVAAVGPLDGIEHVTVEFSSMSTEERDALRQQLRGDKERRTPGVSLPAGCRVIAVTSGKGGVGKSTVTANLAVAAARRGLEVGVLDADVYGYSIPQMLGIQQRPVTLDKMIVPPVTLGVRIMSIGFFLDEDSPVMWRGPMLHRALEQFLGDVHWGDLDVLFVDMPPGTGDVAISLAQLLPRAEVVVVTTPQPAAQKVAQRSAAMAQKMDQRLLGVVENMSAPLKGPAIFGSGGGQLLADQMLVPLLASIPLAMAVREGSDAGIPVASLDTVDGERFRAVADRILAIPAPTPPPPAPEKRIKKPLAML